MKFYILFYKRKVILNKSFLRIVQRYHILDELTLESYSDVSN